MNLSNNKYRKIYQSIKKSGKFQGFRFDPQIPDEKIGTSKKRQISTTWGYIALPVFLDVSFFINDWPK